MSTFQPEHLKLEGEVMDKLTPDPIETRIFKGGVKERLRALGEYSQTHRIKDLPEIAAVYFDTWLEGRKEGLSDEQMGDIFDAGQKGEGGMKWVD